MSIVEFISGKSPKDKYVITKLGILPIGNDYECSQILVAYEEGDYFIDIRINYDGGYDLDHIKWYNFRWNDVEIYIWTKKGNMDLYIADALIGQIYKIEDREYEFEVELDTMEKIVEKLEQIHEVFDLVFTKKIFKGVKVKNGKKSYEIFEEIYNKHKQELINATTNNI